MSRQVKRRPAGASDSNQAPTKKKRTDSACVREKEIPLSQAIVRLFCADRNIRGKVLHYGAKKSRAQQDKVFDEVCDEAVKLLFQQESAHSISHDVGSFDEICDIASDVLDCDDLYNTGRGPEIIPWERVELRTFNNLC
eukprot:gnl/MRDRNA2_/MRDRNA2_80146_c0_seq1.p1 gnl/MRDRNA2_/MRDRNA2_80146_c0~~gnl/MRDRNA2_/MRDRNA2_80146_c0_seq1.p1  ORF type:complete len:139 (+),score=26.38 gnl/MRDRNA2_/MRDRNA2_80146_c0_seq1:207-623(+)